MIRQSDRDRVHRTSCVPASSVIGTQLQEVPLRVATIDQSFPPVSVIDLLAGNNLDLAQQFNSGLLHRVDDGIDVPDTEGDVPNPLCVGFSEPVRSWTLRRTILDQLDARVRIGLQVGDVGLDIRVAGGGFDPWAADGGSLNTEL